MTDKTAGSFSNGFAISNEKGKTYDAGSGTNYIKYSANQYTIIIPDGIKIVKWISREKTITQMQMPISAR